MRREGAHHQVEARVREGQRGDVADSKAHPIGHPGSGREDAGTLDHLRGDVHPGDLDTRRKLGELDGQPARPGSDLED
jgi:hypothetical protein